MKLTLFAAATLVCVLGIMAWQAEAKMDIDELSKGIKEIEAAKAKLGDMDAKLAKAAEAFGPEGKEIYEALKKKAKTALKKGISWLKKKFSDKMEAKRAALEKRGEDWSIGKFRELAGGEGFDEGRQYDVKYNEIPDLEKRTTRNAEWSPRGGATETDKRMVTRNAHEEWNPTGSTETEKRMVTRGANEEWTPSGGTETD